MDEGAIDDLTWRVRDLERDNHELRWRLTQAEDEIKALHTWDGIMRLLEERYPAKSFSTTHGSPGPMIVSLLRKLDRLRNAVADARAASFAEAAEVAGLDTEVGRDLMAIAKSIQPKRPLGDI